MEIPILNIIITIFFIIVFRRINITLAIILSIGISICVIFYLQQKKDLLNDDDERQHKVKHSTILPKPKNFFKYKDIVAFFFSIQDFYSYNPQAYEEIVDSIDSFLKIYEDINHSHKLCNSLYELAENKKNNGINALHSLIFSIPTGIVAIRKLNKSILVLEKILNKYLDNLVNIQKNYVYVNGYNTEHKIINVYPKPSNHYNKEKYTYDLY